MASLTKEQLKNELISHGVQPPVQSARKEEFVKLYEQHVAPIAAQKGDFSSDEEGDAIIEQRVEVSNNSLLFNGLDITTISDDDLFSQLQSFGIPVGPIVDTTRSVYQRKLAALLQNGTQPPVVEVEHTNGNGASHEEKYSDSEDEPQEQKEDHQNIEIVAEHFVQPSSSTPVPAPAPVPLIADPIISTPEPLTVIRKRIAERPPSSVSALPLVDRQGTPTPRPSIRSVSSSSQYTYESRRRVDVTDGSAAKPLPSHSGSPPVKPNIIRYILLLLVLLATAYIIYTFASFGQVKQLMETIRQSVSQYLEKAEQVAEKIDNAKPNPLPDV
ncbi:lamina-associated polypeptide 2-like [Daphnia carinata]|uniref:lamina-associated polypeptide 2-like n=1 Tax=Daphnia carinata TaxID=120202 RepID=UPI002579D9A9|nr:lamina-associated polypeptide 2-like [Daphnia carinata]